MMPEGFESAVFRLDTMAKKDQIGPCAVYVSGDGRPSVTRYHEDGSVSVVALIDGEWREMKESR